MRVENNSEYGNELVPQEEFRDATDVNDSLIISSKGFRSLQLWKLIFYAKPFT